jgi:dephospho-CoA kinase
MKSAKRPSKQRLYALTGGIGSGKTTVANLLKKLGSDIISADLLARKAVQKNSPALRALVKAFGPSIITHDRRLKRKTLATIIFSNPAFRRKAEAIIHREVRQLFKEAILKIKKRNARALIIYDVPLFFEAKLPRSEFDGVIVVYAPLRIAITRAASRMKLSKEQILRRAKNQWPPEKKKKLADFVVNNGAVTKQELFDQVKKLFPQL